MEPVHDTPQDAVKWVADNTDNALFRSNLNGTIVRVN